MSHFFTRQFFQSLILLLACTTAVCSQERGGPRIYKARVTPHWFADDTKFWYQNDLPAGRSEFILVDCQSGTRQRAFDHLKLARALKEAGVGDGIPTRLPIEALEFDPTLATAEILAGGKRWKYALATSALSELSGAIAEAKTLTAASLPGNAPRASRRTGEETQITFFNHLAEEVTLNWLDTGGRGQNYGKIAAGGVKVQHTFAGHVWEVVNANDMTLATFEATETASSAIIDGKISPGGAEVLGGRRGRNRRENGRSPDGKWIATIRDYNVVLRQQDGEGEFLLTTDGREGLSYGMIEWSPDSAALIAFRIEPGDQHQVHLVESSPAAGGRTKLSSRNYPLPGDKFTSYALHLFDVAERKQIECHADKIDFGSPNLRWSKDGHTFTYQQVDRGHQRLRLIEVDAHAGSVRNLIDERSSTFIWTAHTESSNLRPFQWLDKTSELIYVSEKDGWRHLHLVDSHSGAIKNQITQGNYVVRGIERIDEDARQIWFRACGRNAGQDPYFIHYYRVNFDGTGLVPLTESDGTHTAQFSSTNKYLIATYSRADLPPRHELRRAEDGQLVAQFEEANADELRQTAWQSSEVFIAKGRDGQTDIWGLIHRPRNFDPAKNYPVIEQIYAGPHGSHVPKAFSTQRRSVALTDLGFVVVQIDGMGTANRSKAFHDVCWHNLKDAGFPDRILWHQAVAAKYSWYDISRVGIYGTSAGGQNSTGALLFHPEFYKVGVSACGCHDNRMDKASWNEQWMGYPVGPHYAESSNIDNAAKLRGKLMLIVGEMDTNVPPESTFRLADALIKAGKDFDLVVVPGAGHGIGGSYGTRRMHDFFVRHLLKQESPDRNAGN